MDISSNDTTLIRRMVGDTAEAVWSDAEIETTWNIFKDDYNTRRLIRQAAVVELLEELLINNAKIVSYRQNAASVNASDIFKHISQAVKYHRMKLEEMERSTRGSARVVKPKRKPSKLRDYPDA